MTTEPTRKQYMDKEVSFATFYRAIYMEAGVSLKSNKDLISEVRQAIADGDEHLNTISLRCWDLLAVAAESRLGTAFKSHGGFYSLAGGVCAIKQAALDAAKSDLDHSANLWALASNAPYLLQTLKSIAGLTVNDSTDHAQLAALCIAMAQTAVDKAE